jgi:phosphoribosylaminoimidazole-succinocarboxamide synthase
MLTLDLPGIHKLRSGKVREVFELDEQHLLFVATDRLSAFDVVMQDPIPNKGAVLTRLSAFWFEKLRAQGMPNHFVTLDVVSFRPALQPFAEVLAGRSMIVERTEPLPVECVMRGYLAGSGWKEYLTSGTVCGIALRAGLRQSEALTTPIFTPARKAESGHDENITWDQCREAIGDEAAEFVRKRSRQIYAAGKTHAAQRGIIIADTKFEFGRRANGEILLIDECLTPDSSRFWPADSYRPGSSPPSFDKQFVRDWLETQPWDKTPPPPRLPEAVLVGTASRYIEAYERITGQKFEAA